MNLKSYKAVSRSVLIPILFLCAPVAVAQQTCPGMLYATGFDTKPTHGSKDTLIEAVNKGEHIRVGWEIDFDNDGKADLSHWADAAFLSVWEGEVFTQVSAIHAQRPQRGGADIELRGEYTEWRGLLSASGELDGAFSDGATFPTGRSVRITWCSDHQQSPGWVLLYQNSPDGKELAGSKEALIAAIRSGLPIQIGWGTRVERDGETRSVEHLISPVFLNIINGEDVSAQLPEHLAQRRYHDIDEAFFDEPAVMWRGLMTTQGTFDAIWVNRATGEMVRRSPQSAAMNWYAPTAPQLSAPTLAVPNGVTRDEARANERYP